MTMQRVCDGCGLVITPPTAFTELVSGENQRHYHQAVCWPAIRQAILDAQQAIRQA
jgi:hypothetical protein